MVYIMVYTAEAPMTQTAKLFKNGRSQAVRLPAEFRFEGDEVLIRRDEKTGDVILSAKDARRKSWERFLELRKEVEVPDDFLSPEERHSLPETDRDPFEGWEE
jgi:antitoxin VapB